MQIESEIRETAGKKSAFLLTESYCLFQSEGTAEKTQKENIVENVTYSHPMYVYRRCSQFIFHEEM